MTIRTTIAIFVFTCWVGPAWTQLAMGQMRDRSLPSADYYAGFPEYYAGDYSDALKIFVRGANSAFKIGPDERFMDSACYWTMIGECHYQMGNFAEAVVYYEQSLELLLTYAAGDWQQRIDPNPNSIQRSTSAVQRAGINWYQTGRGDAIANVPSSFSIQFGRLDAARALVEGGPLQPPEIRAVDHAEIMRCAALALYRRHSIKGITCQIDPFTARLVSGLSKLPTNTPVLGKWNSVVIGLANVSAGQPERAASQINNGLKFESGLDHNLTPIGLLALTQIAFDAGEAEVAATLALEASYSAGLFNQFDLVEEALSLGTRMHLAQSRSVYPPLTPAIQWAAQNKARLMQTSLLIQLADCLIETDSVDQAAETLVQTRRSMSNTDLNRSVLAARIAYLSAAMTFMNSGDGYPELQQAMTQFQAGSRWLFQMGLVNAALGSGSVSQRQAELIYEQLLLDPTEQHWKLNPMETMAFLTSDHVPAMEAWFEILLARKNHEQAIEVGELIRRHRFFASLPMSGRLLSLRWVLTAPEELLTAAAIAQRNEIYARYPKFQESVNRVAAIEKELRTLPLNPVEKTDDQKKQQALFVEQLKHSRYQETVISGLALRRQPADFVFPAASRYSDISKGLGPKQAVFASLQTGSGYHQFMITQQARHYLGVARTRDVQRGVATLYKKLGITDANNSVDTALLKGTEWKEKAAELKNLIFAKYHDDQWQNFDELVVVPDGVLWYVPFEILQTGGDETAWKNLHESVRIRYLPIVSLASQSNRPTQPESRMAVVTGKLHSKAVPELADQGFEKLADDVTNAVKFSGPAKIPSNLLTTVIDTLVVWADMKSDDRTDAFSLLPFQLDQGRNGATLRGWMLTPWKGPENIIMPMFSSAAADGVNARSDGHELFLTSCGLLASGVRCALISRWRTGGENAIELSRDFAIRIRSMSTPEAMYESMKFAQGLELNLENEIRVDAGKNQTDTVNAEHPFFWAGNMLVDLAGYDQPADLIDAPFGDLNPNSKDANKPDPTDSVPGPPIDEDKGDNRESDGSGLKGQ